jgi:iron complex outermembrane receptor protein
LAILLASASMPARGAVSASVAESASSASGAQQSASDPSQQEIVITAPPLFRGITPERSLDQDAIQSYGISTIDELVGEIEIELGESQDPIIYVNGQRLNDLSEIGALPVEALRNLQVLPRGSAVRAGGRAGQRVISITLKPTVRSATVTAAHKIATEGHWNAERGEAILTRVQGQTRANIALRVRDESSLLESDRHIIQPGSALPYALTGNVIGYPGTGAEIDPLLSSLAGQSVTVAGVPVDTNPTLGDFAANANNPAATDIGQFRTLRPRVRNYDLNGTFATRLAPWLTANATVELVRNLNRFERGLPVASFVLSPTNPASPFSQNVELAYYADRPLIFRTREDSGDANLTLDAEWGAWSANLNARHTDIRDKSFSDRQTEFGGALSDSTNPFAINTASLIPIRTDVASSRSINDAGVLLVSGPVLTLPSGDVQATVEGRLARNHFVSHSSFSSTDNADIRRGEQALRGQLVVPLTSRQNHFLDAIGDLSASIEYSRVHDSDEGTLNNHSFGLTWDPGDFLHVEGEIGQSQLPPALGILGDPTVIAPDVRIFDPLTGQTVDVTEIFGGNPGLRPETDKVRRASAIVRLVPRLNLQANAEYTDTDRRNFISSLPSASAAVMLAFPDRFIRDSQGTLTTIDLRPVNFDSAREKRLRWGFSMNAKLGSGPLPGTPGAPAGPQRPGTYFQLTASHTIVFSDQIVIRPGLPAVDLLGGGAIGIASGRVRHQLDSTAALTSGGLGVRAGITWRGRSSLLSRINGVDDRLSFSSLFTFNLRAFADAGRVIPEGKWAKGFRLALEVVNVTNAHQRVRDSFGATPLQYQPAYRDPIGRTIEIELRKVF